MVRMPQGLPAPVVTHSEFPRPATSQVCFGCLGLSLRATGVRIPRGGCQKPPPQAEAELAEEQALRMAAEEERRRAFAARDAAVAERNAAAADRDNGAAAQAQATTAAATPVGQNGRREKRCGRELCCQKQRFIPWEEPIQCFGHSFSRAH